MPYIVTTTSGRALATIADNTVNTTTTSIALVGKNYAGYGAFLNENYVKLLENFSNSVAPASPITGQLWYDTSSSLVKVFNGSTWKQISGGASNATAPTSPVIGDIWWDTANLQLKVWSGSVWVTVGPATPAGAGGGTGSTTGAVADTIIDNTGLSHIVVKFNVANTVIAILSKDATFTPGSLISGFTTVIPGLNLISTSTLSGAQFTGTASNSTSLNGIAATSYLRGDIDSSTAGKLTVANDNGIIVGSTVSFSAATSAGAFNLTNNTSNSDLNLYVNKAGVLYKAIGISGSSGSVTIAGTLSATATSAQYADLAERFASDSAYEPGTVVQLGGTHEITAVVQDLSDEVFGVISTRAAYLMNGQAGNDATHPAVALSGRVPVRIVGTVNKGDRLVSAGNGLARAAAVGEATAFNVIGRALENKTTLTEGVIEAIVKLNS